MQIPIESLNPSGLDQASEKQKSNQPILDILNRDIKIFKSGIPEKLKEEFYREMHLMFTTGIDMRMALEIFSTEIKRRKHEAIFSQILKDVIEGSPLSQALESAGQFSKYEYSNIKIGEESGTLSSVLGQLASHYKNKVAQKRQLIGALSYPILVFLTSIGAVGFMLQVVVPMFEDVFKRFGSDLPWLTKLVVALSESISAGYPFILAGVGVFTLFVMVYRQKTWFRSIASKTILGIPFFGEIVKSSQLSKFSSAMYLLIAAKHPLTQSLKLVRDMVGFYPIEVSLDIAQEDIIKGSTLSQSLSTHSIYPKKMIALLKMAEEVNKLDVVFAQLRDQYNDDVSYRSGLLSNVLEPILIIFIGSMVGFILIAMYLPLFSLSTSIG